MMKPSLMTRILAIAAAGLILMQCSFQPGSGNYAGGKSIRIEFDRNLRSRVLTKFNGKWMPLGGFSPSETLTTGDSTLVNFSFIRRNSSSVSDAIGKAGLTVFQGENGSIRKEVSITCYDDFPAMAFFRVRYTNSGRSQIVVKGWANNHYIVRSDSRQEPQFWSYQSGSYEERPDWVLPLKKGFHQDNFMGMNASDYGGGTPVSDVWRRDAGIAVGHVEMTPKLVSLPVSMPDTASAEVGVRLETDRVLKPGEGIETLRTFVSVHQGDYFKALSEYRRFMVAQGVRFEPIPETAYEPIWCAWGYERGFTMQQIEGALPKVRELGFKWAVLDDGWQTSEGDWYLARSKFPRGDADMSGFVDRIHGYGLKAGLWWAPLAVDPGTDLIRTHPEYLLLNKDGSKQKISWWDSFYLCPAYPPVLEYTKNLLEKFMKDWGWDGLKIDGQHLNAAPPCYNPAHHHLRPEEAFEKVPEFFKMIDETARGIKPDAVVEICPCGTAYSFFTLPYMNQPVASDPTSSWQIRLKGKTFKALIGPSAAYFGDHVELSDGGDDFASSVGIGAVVGTKFTWPVGSKPENPRRHRRENLDLTPEREKTWKKWLDLYQSKRLSQGTYLGGLYDIGFDRPEAHAIAKSGKMYYAFYADMYRGDVELRGLGKKRYSVSDYVNQKDFGTVKGPAAKIRVQFDKYLLLEAAPQ
jgi:alpha-galactosidase